MDTSFVSVEAVDYARMLIKQGRLDRVSAQCEVDTRFEYPKGTMASYFGKLGAEKRREKKLLRLLEEERVAEREEKERKRKEKEKKKKMKVVVNDRQLPLNL